MRRCSWVKLLLLFLLMSAPAFAKDDCGAYGLLVRDAMRVLPAEHRFPCDAEHLVVVRNVKKFTNSLPEFERMEATKTLKQPWTWAFVSRRKFPIYVLQTGEQGDIAFNYALGKTAPWFKYVMACMLVHEHTHVSLKVGEVAAYRAELNCVNDFKARNQIPQEFSTAPLERAASEEESREEPDRESRNNYEGWSDHGRFVAMGVMDRRERN